tara:strand:+ start:326 stop:1609 length:1284 start_codon:yes stop_codon:yes gene_type:complete
MTKKYKLNSVEIDRIDIKFTGGKFDVLDSYVNMRIDEDIDSGSLQMNLSFLDAADIANKIDFDGTEIIDVKFSSPGQREIEVKFQVYKDMVTPAPDSGTSKIVTLFGVTPEHYTQANVDINQSFRGPISKFAETIFDKLRTKRPFNVDATAGQLLTIVPGMTPFESMEFLAARAYDSNFKSSAFKFYEDMDGYNFRNIESLITDGKADPFVYKQSPSATVQHESTAQQFDIQHLEIDTGKDVMAKVKSGMYASEAKEIDLINQTIVQSTFLMREQFDQFEHLDDDAMSIDSKKALHDHMQTINTSYWLVRNIDSLNEEPNFTEIIPRRMFYLASLEQVRCKLGIPGNSDIGVGKVIHLDILEQTARTKNKEPEEKISGNYVITKVTHLLEKSRGYTQAVEMCKDSFRSNVRNPHKNVVSTRKGAKRL